MKLKIIGDGPLKNTLQQYCENNYITNITFLGAIPHQQVIKEISESYIFSVPSVEAENGDCEAFGMVFAEAQALGTPVVSTKHGGIPEVVLNQMTGLLVEQNNVKKLATALEELFTNKPLRNRLRDNGIKHISNKFDI
jgi:colanic acid/amylovoran biosynthesis glycosyltransferase